MNEFKTRSFTQKLPVAAAYGDNQPLSRMDVQKVLLAYELLHTYCCLLEQATVLALAHLTTGSGVFNETPADPTAELRRALVVVLGADALTWNPEQIKEAYYKSLEGNL